MDLENYSNTILLGFLSIITLVTGFLLNRYPPKKINGLYGYRTKRSMKNQAQWDYSQRYSGNLFLWFGVILSILSVLAIFFPVKAIYGDIAIVVVFCIGSIFIIFRTEKALDKKFKE